MLSGVVQRHLAVLTGLWFCAVTVQAGEIDSLLDRMQEALATLNYQGTLVVRQRDQMHTLHVVHGHDEAGNSWDTLEALNGESRRVIRRDDQVITLFPDKQTATRISDPNLQSLPLRPRLPRDLDSLNRLYQITLAGDDRVAGWPARIINMQPLDHYRYGYRLWLARDNGLLLRCDLLAENGQVVEQVMYSHLTTLKQIPPPGVPDLKNWKVLDLDARQNRHRDTRDWQVRQLPEGFRLVQSIAMPESETAGEPNRVSQQLIFSDGMNSVSVFVERRVPGKQLVGVSRMGAVNAFGQAMDGHHVTVIGEVPVETVRQMAQSTAPVSEPAAEAGAPVTAESLPAETGDD